MSIEEYRRREGELARRSQRERQARRLYEERLLTTNSVSKHQEGFHPIFTKHYFHPDETTTSRVESAHRALKVSLYSPKYDSLALAETFAVAVDRQNINIIQDIERQRNQHRSTKVSVSLGAEWQVSKEAIEKAILIYNKWTSP
ncbi:hypothetical protein N7489_002472 [Penicillium chrysogenum]|uniref:uncharacterized protein n=1 Tax=Penicillium chrysogenum TaxID=5076 RepID=UPI00238F3978|nr:uncharacterized protein N7489_002472 [Penicillium chrysogenum]KAJ5248202.1 hypothetical protein N7524_012162 [Penicillium chrysogenum]KAJ5252062.1 hypothetical protein N7489_002472 [Penicillium chrysogenum]KAJ6146280.1 hypothetical protein N7497_008262 [Penicillium chrysogenum]